MYACVRKYIFLRLYYVNMYVLDSITKFYTEIRIKHLHIKTACFPPLPPRAGVELRTHLSQAPSMDADGNLVMPLRDSAFHRLLLHGVCQFYCLKSKVPIPIYLPYLLRGCAWSYVRVCMNACMYIFHWTSTIMYLCQQCLNEWMYACMYIACPSSNKRLLDMYAGIYFNMYVWYVPQSLISLPTTSTSTITIFFCTCK